MKINLERIKEDLLEVGSIANSGEIGYTRLAFSKEEKMAMNWLKGKLKANGIQTYEDSVGNVFGREGELDSPAIAFGSHLDTVQNGGLYDGALGVIVGLEVLRTIKENGYETDVPLELISFIGEEANPLGGTFGSRVMAGLIKESDLSEITLQEFGYTFNDIKDACIDRDKYLSFLELHIEQGSVLETEKKHVGIVTSIAGISRMHVHVIGKASHSGTTPMQHRMDALVSASSIVKKVSEEAINRNSDLVATVGKLEVSPNSENVVPGDVHLTIEIRSSNWNEVKEFENHLKSWMNSNFNVEMKQGVQKQPNKLSEEVQKSIEKASKNTETNYKYMVSGANHDANSLTSLTNVGMIFVPCKDGLSHHPDEYTSWEDIEFGANTMLNSILELSKQYASLIKG
ncbi:M20 family metallo-hydrolase [Virgibacillus byunsanensis]|uniref:M20 family metallo-hydrolase n=1 Tax=Virgibacillus byunsanensis TaxID=570945 RepID=A0ABW3LMS4_9BACI